MLCMMSYGVHNWVYFDHRLCVLLAKLRYLKNKKLFSITVKELFEPNRPFSNCIDYGDLNGLDHLPEFADQKFTM